MARHESRMKALGWENHLGRDATLVRLRLLGRYPVRVQHELQEAVAAMEAAWIATDYENPCDYIGSYMYRTIGNAGRVWSTHAYGTAIDHDYGGDTDGDGDPTIDKNPHVHRPITVDDPGWGVEWQINRQQVRAVEAIKNLWGEPMWRWLGWSIGDTMHWQINVRPERTAVDWSTVMGTEFVCPWPDPCESHYRSPDAPAESKGMCGLPSSGGSPIPWAMAVVDWAEQENRLRTADDHRDWWTSNVDTGRYLTMEARAAGAV